MAHTATLEVKLSSRTLKDIIEEQLVGLSPAGNAIFQSWLWSSEAVGV